MIRQIRQRQRKQLIICFRVLYAAASFNHQLWAMGLSFSAAASSIRSEDALDLNVIISGLEDNIQNHCFRNLAAFDFKVCYDHTALNFHSYMLRSGLDRNRADGSGELTLNFSDNTVADLSDVSCIWDFSFRSPDSLSLARISFFGSGLESNSLSFGNDLLDEDKGGLFSANWGDRKQDISDASNPAAMLILRSGMAEKNGVKTGNSIQPV